MQYISGRECPPGRAMPDISHYRTVTTELDGDRIGVCQHRPLTSCLVLDDGHLPRDRPLVGVPVPGCRGHISGDGEDHHHKKYNGQNALGHTQAVYNALYIGFFGGFCYIGG